MIQNLCRALARVAASAWVGAATLFVVSTLKEVRSPLDSATKAFLATLRFPSYYQFGFGLIGGALVLALIAGQSPGAPRRRWWCACGLLLLALVLMGIDYVFVYGPLAEMTAAVESARPASFVTYHRASMWINTAHVGVSLLAALALSWPTRSASSTSPPAS